MKVVVPKNQSHSFITHGSPDTMVRFGVLLADLSALLAVALLGLF